MLLATDLMHPVFAEEMRRHKKKRLVQGPSSYFMDVKCRGCSRIATIFSHAQTVVPCAGCSLILCRPRGGKCKLTAGCAFRWKYSSADVYLCTHYCYYYGPWVNESKPHTQCFKA